VTLIPDILSFVASNLIFVESPAGVGWSYSNTTSDYNSGDVSTGNKCLFSFSPFSNFYFYIKFLEFYFSNLH